MDNITGFIVKVKPKGSGPIEYKYNDRAAQLTEEEDFVGYFRMMSNPEKSDPPYYGSVQKITLVDREKLLFRYEDDAIFNLDEVNITIVAKRGPERNNRYLPEFYNQFDTWNNV
ncbi:hypothetical protein [Rufibacter roseolus]|uniref:hypothetical protein n=1 Tax=Rufibacter roseolus TaxID=2817375 RepID=UPI001B30666F|nr:hypothetical protein [Rufibacter roseolus]